MKAFTVLRLMASTALLSCVSGLAVAQQVRAVGSFQQLKVSGAVDVVLTQGETTTVKVDADPNVLERIKTEVQGNTLLVHREWSPRLADLRPRREWGSRLADLRSGKVNVYITCPTLTGVEVSGGSSVKSTAPFKASEFSIRAGGASDVTLRLDVTTLRATASGASELRLVGYADHQQVRLSGSSDYRAYDLQGRSATVDASGGSDAYMAVSERLDSHTSGASDIQYKGRPRVSR